MSVRYQILNSHLPDPLAKLIISYIAAKHFFYVSRNNRSTKIIIYIFQNGKLTEFSSFDKSCGMCVGEITHTINHKNKLLFITPDESFEYCNKNKSKSKSKNKLTTIGCSIVPLQNITYHNYQDKMYVVGGNGKNMTVMKLVNKMWVNMMCKFTQMQVDSFTPIYYNHNFYVIGYDDEYINTTITIKCLNNNDFKTCKRFKISKSSSYSHFRKPHVIGFDGDLIILNRCPQNFGFSLYECAVFDTVANEITFAKNLNKEYDDIRLFILSDLGILGLLEPREKEYACNNNEILVCVGFLSEQKHCVVEIYDHILKEWNVYCELSPTISLKKMFVACDNFDD